MKDEEGHRPQQPWIDDELLSLVIMQRQLPKFVDSSFYYPLLVDHLLSLKQNRRISGVGLSSSSKKGPRNDQVGTSLAYAVASLCEESLHLFGAGLVCKSLSLHPSLFTVNNSLSMLYAFLLSQTRTEEEEKGERRKEEEEEDGVSKSGIEERQLFGEQTMLWTQCRDMCGRALKVLLHDCPHLLPTSTH